MRIAGMHSSEWLCRLIELQELREHLMELAINGERDTLQAEAIRRQIEAIGDDIHGN